MSNAISWPRKTREIHSHHFDSTRWNGFEFRDDDIVIGTWAKAGTTWTQQIVSQLVFHGAEDAAVFDVSPWVDLRAIPRGPMFASIEAQRHRRYLKTHLPVDALVFSPKAKYIYVARDARDVVMSQYNHHVNATQLWYDMMNSPGLVGPRLERPNSDIRQYFNEWVAWDGYPWWPFWSHIQSWWDIRRLPNVLLIHFANLKADMPSEIRRIAKFLTIDVDAAEWPKILEHCSFDYMKAHANRFMMDAVFDGGAKTFVNKGTNGRWRDVLTADDVAFYERTLAAQLTPDCAHWLTTGHLPH
jgi:aryl sulfotransferase